MEPGGGGAAGIHGGGGGGGGGVGMGAGEQEGDDVDKLPEVFSLLFFSTIDFNKSSSELKRKPACSFLFMFEQRLTNFSMVSHTTSIKLSSSVNARKLCNIWRKFVA